MSTTPTRTDRTDFQSTDATRPRLHSGKWQSADESLDSRRTAAPMQFSPFGRRHLPNLMDESNQAMLEDADEN